jgi:hypothetical protein
LEVRNEEKRAQGGTLRDKKHRWCGWEKKRNKRNIKDATTAKKHDKYEEDM